MIPFLFLQVAALAGSPDELPTIRIEGDYLLLRHLAADGSNPAAVDRDFRLLRAPDGVRSIILTPAQQSALLRRRLPALALQPRATTTIRIEFERMVDTANRLGCLATNQPVGAGEWIDATRAQPVACDASRARARLDYDAVARAPRAVTALPAASYLGPVVLPAALPQEPGRTMTLRTRVGPVTIDRSAVLMQPGRPGRSAFVRLSDGSVFAARLADEGK